MNKAGKSKATKQAGNIYPLVGLRLDNETRALVEQLAREEDRKLSQMCARLVKEALRARGRLANVS
jgi:hypothetical protein